jgi:hypothetical protein
MSKRHVWSWEQTMAYLLTLPIFGPIIAEHYGLSRAWQWALTLFAFLWFSTLVFIGLRYKAHEREQEQR